MDLVLFHSGKLPLYLEYAFRQIRIFNPNLVVYFITDKENLNNDIFDKYNITKANKDLYWSKEVGEFEVLYNKPGFWTITATRLIYIKNFIRDNNFKDVYCFENDVLLYYDLSELHEVFLNNYKGLAITVGGVDKCMTGFMFIKDYKALEAMTDFFIMLLKQNSIREIRDKYKLEMVNEMTLMRIYFDEKGMGSLPTMPFGIEYNVSGFNSIFDPASWGQFVGGTTNGIPGAKPKDHYIGVMLENNPEFTVTWRKDNFGRKQPYFKYNDKEVRINNLHIHSKNLHLYMSND